MILVMSETLPLAEVKSKFSEMVDRVEHTHDRIVVTRNGRPAAVMISPDELASLEDTLDLLSDTDAMSELADARLAHDNGDYVGADGLRARFSTS
jgi:antitoxin YefM